MSQPPDEKAIFNVIKSIPSLAERNDYLDFACGDDVEARRRIEELLDAHTETGGFLSSNAPANLLGQDITGGFSVGDRAGVYKLLEKIGEGGFGEVYMAEQSRPIERRVAVKVIKPGMDSKQVIARFEAERQALALMNHPNIANIFDAGQTESGRPFFAMELVRGVPITQYCDERNLSTEGRLALFKQVCSAIQHAHHKGIIHRDIKPSNILVTTNGDQPLPKVIDFGVAKATQGRLTEKTLFTKFQQFIGTPIYMSPEQAQMSAVDVDTRSDIYSLGVLLYELLTGATPLNTAELQQAGFDELCRRIREEDAPKPSSRLSSLSQDEVKTRARSRGVEPSEWLNEVSHELDWIVMKAMEKERTRRYDTASSLAADVQRFLENEPVEAGPPSLTYRLRKFTSRYRVAVITTSLIVLAMVAGTVASSIGFVQARRAQRRLEDSQETLQQQFAVTNSARQEAEVNLYAAEMNRAATAYQQGNAAHAMMFLERHRETRGDRFEWRLLHHMCQTDDAIHTFRSHSDRVNSIAVSSRGVIASASSDESFCLFDIGRRRELASQAMSSEVTDVDFSPDGSVLAVVEKGRGVTLWDVDSLKRMRRLPGTSGDALAHARFLPDGDTLLVVRNWQDRQVQLFKWRDSEAEPMVMEGLFGRDLSVSPVGDMFALVQGGNVAVWRTTEDDPFRLANFIEYAQDWTIDDIAVSKPSGRWLASTAGANVRIWDVTESAAARRSGNRDQPFVTLPAKARSLVYSPDGSTLAVGRSNGHIEIWRGEPPWATNERPLRSLQGHRDGVSSIAFSHDGQWIVSGSADSTVKLWSTSQPTVAPNTLVADDWVFDVAFSPDDKLLASTGFDGRVIVWDLETKQKQLDEKRHNHEGLRIAFSPDGTWLASSSGHWRYGQNLRQETLGRLSLLNLKDRQQDHYVEGITAEVRWFDLSPTAPHVAFSELRGDLRIWDFEKREMVARAEMPNGIRQVRFSPDGKYLALATNQGGELRSATSLNVLSSFADRAQSKSLSFSADGRRLAYGYVNRVLVFDTGLPDTPKLARWKTLDGSEGVWNLRFLSNGQTLAAATSRSSVALWNLESGRDVVTIPAGHGYATGLDISNSGDMLASSGADKSIRIWRAEPNRVGRE